MARDKRPVIVKQGAAEWIVTYGDMMSLLLCFFVLLVSFSSMQEEKFQEAARSLRLAFGVLVDPESALRIDDPIVPRYETAEPRDLLVEVRELETTLLDRGVSGDVQVEVLGDGILFRLEAPVLFAAGRADLQPASHDVLESLAGFLQKFPGEIRIEGHSDNVPILTDRFPSNWELSAARAGAVARYFQGYGLQPTRLAATGYGEHRPLAGNDDAEGRARNRRVEIFLKVDRIGPAAGGKPLSRAVDRTQADAPRPTPVSDRLRIPRQAP
ncbi:MAG TPA: OmpA family protein [Candidatus Krumholzibacteria bacterium]|nr:OmpA family protein [Candidatus Krumholzibacteria bacterium]HPD71619.1 OmpA family protein [Candidatus Krumholzibacteria bacterium]HRY41448.1 OmpA family protein [Candidatus Krumholzibacteria bacterium]